MSMYAQQMAMLALESVMMVGIVLGLFRARTVLGLTPLYIVLGGFQYLEATLSLRVEALPGITIYPASVVMFTATLMTVLVIYVKEDAIEARKLAYGLVLANVSASVLSLIVGYHVAMPGSIAGVMESQDFLSSAWIAAIGTSLLFLDVLGIILVYEFVSRFARHLFPRLAISLVVVATIDNVLFTLAVQGVRPEVLPLMTAGGAGKAAAAIFYAAVCTAYFRFAEPHTATVGTGDVADVFQTLTYRQKYEAVWQRMIRDGLTGLYNRGYFDEALPQALARARREGTPLSLLIIDTDHFKSINDQLSHMEGDAVLRLIAAVLLSEARGGDVPCRYGGDEFVVILPNTDRQAAERFAQRFRAELDERCTLASPPFPWGRVSTTTGIASVPADGDLTPEMLIRVADRRLYDGKHAGRDTVVATDARGAAPVPQSAPRPS